MRRWRCLPGPNKPDEFWAPQRRLPELRAWRWWELRNAIPYCGRHLNCAMCWRVRWSWEPQEKRWSARKAQAFDAAARTGAAAVGAVVPAAVAGGSVLVVAGVVALAVVVAAASFVLVA